MGRINQDPEPRVQADAADAFGSDGSLAETGRSSNNAVSLALLQEQLRELPMTTAVR
jgi:hypothetical protein